MSATYRPALVPAGHAIMRGKLLLNQSRSTSLSRKRVSMPGLLRKREFDRHVVAHGYGLRLRLRALMPGYDRVASGWDIGNLEIAVRIGLGEIRGGRHDHEPGHFGMHVAKQRHDSGRVELEAALLPGRPGTHTVPQFLIAADRRPENVMRYFVVVLELHRGSHLHHHHVRHEQQLLLI